MKNNKSIPPPARPLSKEELTFKVKEFPVTYGASIVGITTVETLAGGPPSTDLSYVLEGARSAVTFAVPLDEQKTREYLGKIDREGHQKDHTKTSVIIQQENGSLQAVSPEAAKEHFAAMDAERRVLYETSHQ